MCRLTVSVVVYQLDLPVLRQCLQSLLDAVQCAAERGLLQRFDLYVVDNGDNAPQLRNLLDDLNPQQTDPQQTETGHPEPHPLKSMAHLLHGHGNVGFGSAHNLVIHQLAEQPEEPGHNDIYLILNPDVFLQQDTLAEGIGWLAQHADTVALAPAIRDGDGNTVSACKRYPSVLDFLLRGFAPAFVKNLFRTRLDRYDMRELPANTASSGIPIISGCFMLFRLDALQRLQGFDPRYFLYFEDFDLSLRAHRLGTLTCLPAMQITHLGGHAARKGLQHIRLFVRSGVQFFNTHGWRWL